MVQCWSDTSIFHRIYLREIPLCVNHHLPDHFINKIQQISCFRAMKVGKLSKDGPKHVAQQGRLSRENSLQYTLFTSIRCTEIFLLLIDTSQTIFWFLYIKENGFSGQMFKLPTTLTLGRLPSEATRGTSFACISCWGNRKNDDLTKIARKKTGWLTKKSVPSTCQFHPCKSK